MTAPMMYAQTKAGGLQHLVIDTPEHWHRAVCGATAKRGWYRTHTEALTHRAICSRCEQRHARQAAQESPQ